MSSFMNFSAIASTAYAHDASRILGRDLWVLTKGFSFYIGNKESGRWVHVPAGFMTDGASVPRAFWSLIPPWGIYGQAAILHDYLCEYLSITVDGQPQPISRQYADELFNEAMKVLEVPGHVINPIMDAITLYRKAVNPTTPSVDHRKREQEAIWWEHNGHLY